MVSRLLLVVFLIFRAIDLIANTYLDYSSRLRFYLYLYLFLFFFIIIIIIVIIVIIVIIIFFFFSFFFFSFFFFLLLEVCGLSLLICRRSTRV